MFEAQSQAKIEAGLLGGAEEEIRRETFARQQLIAEMQREVEVSGHVTRLQLEELVLHEQSIEALNRQADAYRMLGHVANDAIGGMAAGAFNAYADALDKTVSLNALFAGGFDRALRNQAAAVVRSVGQQAAIRSIFELAQGFAALGTPGMQGLAAFHFKSAAIFGSIAVASGPGAGLLSVAPAGAGGGEGRGRADRDGGGDRAGGPSYQVTVIGNLDDQGAADLVRRLRQAEERGDA